MADTYSIQLSLDIRDLATLTKIYQREFVRGKASYIKLALSDLITICEKLNKVERFQSSTAALEHLRALGVMPDIKKKKVIKAFSQQILLEEQGVSHHPELTLDFSDEEFESLKKEEE